MKFDIARQPLVPAFLTLAALAVVAMWNAGGPAVSMAVQAGHAAGTVDIGRNAAGALAVSSPGELLAQFQAAPSRLGALDRRTADALHGMSVGRLTVRYNLYSVGTCLAIPLYGAIACGLAVGGDCLTTFAASALLALATKNFCRSYCNGFGFDAIFRASLYIGLLPLVATAAAPLLILLPLAVMLFRRTLREVAVAVAACCCPLSRSATSTGPPEASFSLRSRNREAHSSPERRCRCSSRRPCRTSSCREPSSSST